MTVPRLGRADLADRLAAAVPEFGTVLAEHVADNDGEVLHHLLFWDLGQFARDAHDRGDAGLAGRILAFLERLLAEGDEACENVVLVAVVESFATGGDADARFVATWPQVLRRRAETCWA
jgi:hypothetical protein